jgi:hypothetical protein
MSALSRRGGIINSDTHTKHGEASDDDDDDDDDSNNNECVGLEIYTV